MGQYCDSMVIYQNSVWKLHKKKEFMDMQEKYNQQKLLNEKNQLKIENITLPVTVTCACSCTATPIKKYEQKVYSLSYSIFLKQKYDLH